MNRTIKKRARSMLSASRLDNGFWADVVNTIAYLINKSPTTALDGQILEEVWCGKQVDYSHLRTFNCDAFSLVPKEKKVQT